MFKFKALAIAATALTSIVFAVPTSSQAMPQAAPAKIDAASNGNLVQVYHRGYYYNYYYDHCYARIHRSYHEHYRDCNDYYPYYGYYRPSYGYRTYYRPYYGDYPYYDYYEPGISVYIR